ncbi:hypothetical protein CIB48_g11355 [Xylaria polymorpha]|nr:hypothetical protein CIB48_g11355 [Xylaria polymorpha]
MDALKKVVGGGSHSTSSTNAPAAGAGAGAGAVGASYINKKYLGNKFSHDQLESITDAGRGAFEKSTGKQVSSKISN